MREKKIFLIRHAESEANAGVVVAHDNTIKITQKGKDQSEALKEIIDEPNRIVVSKLIRTIETAEPTIKKYPDSEVHLWTDTHEFNPVSPKDILNLKGEEKYKDLSDKYWEKLDPNFKADQSLESFVEFVDRINFVILKLKKIPDGVNCIFTHGWFIKMFHLLTQEFSDFHKLNSKGDIYLIIMKRFISFDKEWKTINTGIYDVSELVEKYGQ